MLKLGPGYIFHDNIKLIAVQPEYDTIFESLLNDLGRQPYQFISRLGPHGVVDGFKVIDIHHDDAYGNHLIRLIRPSVPVIAAPVKKSGQGIIVNAVLQLPGILPPADLLGNKIDQHIDQFQGMPASAPHHHDVSQLTLFAHNGEYRHIVDLLPLHVLIKFKGFRQDIMGLFYASDPALMVLVQPSFQMAFQIPAGRRQIRFISPAGTLIAKAIVLLKEYLDMACFIVVRQHIHKAAQGFFHGFGFHHGVNTADHRIGHIRP